MSATFPVITLQPVCDQRSAWVALFIDFDDPAAANEETLGRLWREFGLDEVLGVLPCIVKLADPVQDLSHLPAAHIILCLPVAVCCDPAHHSTLAALKARGFRIMATDAPTPGAALDPTVGAVAMHCPGPNAPAGALTWLEKLPGPHLALGAERVTCPGRCHFSWFAGGYGIHPPMTTTPVAKNDPPNHGLLLELLAAVTNEADSAVIEAIVKRDPQLSYHLLRLVNSVAFGPSKKISGFGQAIALLGRRQLQRWLQLLLYARSSKAGVANPLMVRAAFRAGLMEALCREMSGPREAQDRAFMTGMLSLLDELLGMPLQDVTRPLNLADDVLAALGDHGGPLGGLLAAVEAAEGATAADCARSVDANNIDHESWARALIGACRWAEQVGREH